MLDVSSFTLKPNGGGANNTSPTRSNSLTTSKTNGGGSRGRIVVEDPRWKWVDEQNFPKPREFIGKQRRYRAGRGSSVPLDLSGLQ